MGRRAYKKVTTNGPVTLHQRYLYRDYLQIACIDLTRSHRPALWLLLWDPTQPVSTRPLAIQKNGTWYSYGWDSNKNICEIYATNGYIVSTQTYTPSGASYSNDSTGQPINWSSEYKDSETNLIYYNYRYYNPERGRWTSRDLMSEKHEHNRYFFSISPSSFDWMGLNKKEKKNHIKSFNWTVIFDGIIKAIKQSAHDSVQLQAPVYDAASGTITETFKSENKASVTGTLSLTQKYELTHGDINKLTRKGLLSDDGKSFIILNETFGVNTSNGRQFTLPVGITTQYQSGKGQYISINTGIDLKNPHAPKTINTEMGVNCATYKVYDLIIRVDLKINNEIKIANETKDWHDTKPNYGVSVGILPQTPLDETPSWAFAFDIQKGVNSDAVFTFGIKGTF